jgi:hypothetical protein
MHGVTFEPQLKLGDMAEQAKRGLQASFAVSEDPEDRARGAATRIVFGLDQQGRPHASIFADADGGDTAHAAALMHMGTLKVEGATLQGIADKLPRGKIFASGKAFVPFVKQCLYDQLVANLPAGVQPPTRPVRAAEPSVTVRQKLAGGMKAIATASSRAQVALPDDWSKITTGSLVLACVEQADGWWPAIITEVSGDGVFVLQWQGWSDWEPFIRKSEELALLHPSFVAA